MQKIIIAILISFIALSGCTQNQDPLTACAQVITPAVSPEGTCSEFPTPCDVPKGFTLVDSCDEPEPQPEPEPEPEEPVIEPAPIIPTPEPIPEPQSKFDFNAELKYCEYDGLFQKYNWMYRIRNNTDNRPTYGAKVWMKIDELDKAQVKTIQDNYTKNQVLWEELQYSHTKYGTFRGQVWDIRNVETPGDFDFKLIYCEPEFDKKDTCTESTGIVIAEGNTSELCDIAGQID
tara:strand:- start:7224 stop:7922 length:699 start_codon:yes stop_codon:yes gene_type:complete